MAVYDESPSTVPNSVDDLAFGKEAPTSGIEPAARL
jgi:hypothetical protein